MTDFPLLLAWRLKQTEREFDHGEANTVRSPSPLRLDNILQILIEGAVSGELCRYCSRPLLSQSGSVIQHCCPFCGWAKGRSHSICGPELYAVNTECILKEFKEDSANIALDELARHLTRKYDDVWKVNPFRFEDLVADVFKQQGFEVAQTQKSKDGGYDLLLMEGASRIIVEVKRRKTVGVSVVRELMGVQLRDDFKRAKLVTAGRFTRGARIESLNSGSKKYGFEMDLTDAEELLRFLRVYDLPTSLRRSLEDREKMTTEELARQLAGSRWDESRASEARRRRIHEAKVAEERAAHFRSIPTKPGPPCPECGKLLRTSLAKQCWSCGADWHDRPT